MVMEKIEVVENKFDEISEINFQNVNTPFNFESFSDNCLTKLAQLSQYIQKPNIYGEFNTEEHYLETLKLVLDSTHETANRLSFFSDLIIPAVLGKNRLLDIGPGDCALTKVVAPNFRHITAVDLNLHILNELGDQLPQDIEFLKIPQSAEKVVLESSFYDLGVLSHVLYYVDSSKWLDVVRKTYRSLNNNGKLVIVLGGDELNKAHLIHHFGGETLKINDLALECQKLFGFSNVSFFASDEAFYAKTLDAMLHIAAFMLKDAKITASKKDLIQYIEKYLKRNDGLYEMTTKQKYIVIDKRQQNYTDMMHGVEEMALSN